MLHARSSNMEMENKPEATSPIPLDQAFVSRLCCTVYMKLSLVGGLTSVVYSV